MSAANRRRGANAERSIVNYLRLNGWPDARRYLAGDGRQPGDIDWHPLVCLEVKDVAASAWPTWCRQAAAEAPAGTVPVVVRRERGVTDVGQWPCRVHSFGWWFATDEARLSPVALPNTHVDGERWLCMDFAALVAAVAALDAPGAVA